MDKVVLALEKIGSVLVDRRLWMAVIAVSVALATLGATQRELSEEEVAPVLEAFAELAFALAKVLAILAPLFKLISSWTVRPPSGLDFKETRATIIR